MSKTLKEIRKKMLEVACHSEKPIIIDALNTVEEELNNRINYIKVSCVDSKDNKKVRIDEIERFIGD